MPNETQPPLEKDWTNIIFLALTPVIAIAGTAWYTWRFGFEWWMLALLVVMYSLVGLSICMGYHRYFSHKSYECAPVVRLGFAIFGAMALQDSILNWSAGHRNHHKHVDSDWDPYNIKRGFWWAHIIWIFFKKADQTENVRDLKRDPIVQWQHHWYKLVGLGGGLLLPTLVGALFGSPLAGLLWGGFVRIVVIHHTTFFVNSLAHEFGAQEFDDTVSARDNWVVALMTLGEGYHSFHHKFPSDFRNGVRWYHWDPSKWFILTLKGLGLASNLRSTPAPLIEQTRMQVALKHMQVQMDSLPTTYRDEIQARIDWVRARLEEAMAYWRQYTLERKQGLSDSWRQTRQKALDLQREARREWRRVTRMLAAAPSAA